MICEALLMMASYHVPAAIPTVFIERDGIALHLARITGAYAVALRYTF
jgi:hypothetical protein